MLAEVPRRQQNLGCVKPPLTYEAGNLRSASTSLEYLELFKSSPVPLEHMPSTLMGRIPLPLISAVDIIERGFVRRIFP